MGVWSKIRNYELESNNDTFTVSNKESARVGLQDALISNIAKTQRYNIFTNLTEDIEVKLIVKYTNLATAPGSVYQFFSGFTLFTLPSVYKFNNNFAIEIITEKQNRKTNRDTRIVMISEILFLPLMPFFRLQRKFEKSITSSFDYIVYELDKLNFFSEIDNSPKPSIPITSPQ